MEFPKLTLKQQTFIEEYLKTENASKAYRVAYDGDAKASTVAKEASRLLKTPAVKKYIEYVRYNQAEVVQEEIKYSALEAFNEFEAMKQVALEGFGKYNDPNVMAAIKAIEDKAKLAGLLKDVTTLEAKNGISLYFEKALEKAKKLEEQTQGD